MAKRNTTTILEVMYSVCCGLDIHKRTISACLLYTDEHGEQQIEIRKFGTFTYDLMHLRDWLLEHECPIVAMESTGIYWRPIHNVLEDYVKVV